MPKPTPQDTIFIVVTGNAVLNTCFDKGCNLLFHHGDSVWLSLVARWHEIHVIMKNSTHSHHLRY